MNTFPLIRSKWSNEHIMAVLFISLCLYHLPKWSENPASILSFIFIVLVGLFLDTLINIIRHKHLVCSVSAAVTAAMLSVLTYGVPIWGQSLGVAIALLIGKHIWGGTGKNLINPGITGLLFILLIFDVPYPFFHASFLLLPGLILSIPFIVLRPYAGVGYMLGMVSFLFFTHSFTFENLLLYGVIFWSCLVLTDPVTVTIHPVYGSLISYLAGFIALLFDTPIALVLGILAVNLISYAVESVSTKTTNLVREKIKIKKITPYINDNTKILDLTGEKDYGSVKNGEKQIKEESDLPIQEILKRIHSNEVYGLGGAGFSTYQKIITVLDSTINQKYLIINGVECDPGLIHDHWLLRTYSYEIMKGIDFICKCVRFEAIILAVKDPKGLNYPDAITITTVPDFFPVGAEKILISRILHTQLEEDMIPAEKGILVLNAQTVYSIYHAVSKNEKTDTRFLTVANLKSKNVQIVKVKLGTKIRKIMEDVYPGVINVFAGGGLMQAYIADEDAVIDKTVNYIATGAFPRYKESPQCSKCGICSIYCPAGLKVNRIADLVDKGNTSSAKRYHVNKCIGCGICSYSCLAGRNLAYLVKTAKENEINIIRREYEQGI